MHVLLRPTRLLFNGIVLFTCVMLGITFWLQQRDHDLHMKLIPRALQATGIAYQKEEIGGFGPGANESVAIVFALPAEIVGEIDRKQIAFFSGLSTPWGDWKPTPVPFDNDPNWARTDSYGYVASASPLDRYLNKWGFGIDIDPAIKATIDRAVSEPGSYYAYGHASVTIVAPALNQAFYLFAG